MREEKAVEDGKRTRVAGGKERSDVVDCIRGDGNRNAKRVRDEQGKEMA